MNQETCRKLFFYQDGHLYWCRDRGSNAKSGSRAGRLLKTGYISIHVSGRRYQEHRLVFLYHFGFMPKQIDHINGIKDDNRIENLREANHSLNQMNTTPRSSESGERGVRYRSDRNKWIARIYKNGKEIRIGSFSTKEEATSAYKQVADEMYGGFVR